MTLDSQRDGIEQRAPWWSTFFSGAALELWRQAIPPGVTAREVELLCERFDLGPGSRALDVPCGPGRIALGLAARGVAVTGIDICAEFVDEAQRSARQRSLPATFERRDMRHLHRDGEAAAGFDAVLCMGNSFGYLAGDQNDRFLRDAVHALASGGHLVLQTAVTAETALYGFVAEDIQETRDMTLRAVSSYDAPRGVQRVEYTIARKDRSVPREVKVAEYRIYTVRQLCEILRDAGLVDLEVLGDLGGSAFHLGDRQVHLLGRRETSAVV